MVVRSARPFQWGETAYLDNRTDATMADAIQVGMSRGHGDPFSEGDLPPRPQARIGRAASGKQLLNVRFGARSQGRLSAHRADAGAIRLS